MKIKDLIFGPKDYHSTMVEARETVLPMPEGIYKVKAYRYIDTWKRPLWFTRTITRIRIEPIDWFPAPDWKAGIECMSLYADTIEEGVGWVVGNNLKLRLEKERGVVWN